MSEYIGLTIGPIYPTLKQARRTRELWGASFLFSSVFKQVAIKLKDWVILPYVDENESSSVGLYPDRIVLGKNNGKEKLTMKKVYEEINLVFKEISDDYCNICGDIDNDSALQQLKSAIQIHAFELEIPKGDNIIFLLYQQLDNMELFNQMPSSTTLLPDYFEQINRSKLYKWAGWGESTRLRSLFEISAVSLKDHTMFDNFIQRHFIDVEKYEKVKNINTKQRLEIKHRLEQFTNNCKTTFGEKFKPYHKYFAMVHGDGDNMGKIVSSVGTAGNKITEFSKVLYEFGKKAGEIIENYGGFPVYIGGDDLLFFAPLANPLKNEAKNILELIQKLDEEFTDHHKQSIKDLITIPVHDPSFSYGVSVNFFKFPLKESLENSYQNLQKAKSTLFKNKNALFITLQKHSGQQIETGFEKSDLFYSKMILPFINDFCFSEKNHEYNSFRKKSAEYHPFLKHLKTYGGTVSNFLKMNFSEHDFEKDIYGYWYRLGTILSEAYSNPAEADRKAEMVYFAIRFIDFLNSETND